LRSRPSDAIIVGFMSLARTASAVIIAAAWSAALIASPPVRRGLHGRVVLEREPSLGDDQQAAGGIRVQSRRDRDPFSLESIRSSSGSRRSSAVDPGYRRSATSISSRGAASPGVREADRAPADAGADVRVSRPPDAQKLVTSGVATGCASGAPRTAIGRHAGGDELLRFGGRRTRTSAPSVRWSAIRFSNSGDAAPRRGDRGSDLPVARVTPNSSWNRRTLMLSSGRRISVSSELDANTPAALLVVPERRFAPRGTTTSCSPRRTSGRRSTADHAAPMMTRARRPGQAPLKPDYDGVGRHASRGAAHFASRLREFLHATSGFTRFISRGFG